MSRIGLAFVILAGLVLFAGGLLAGSRSGSAVAEEVPVAPLLSASDTRVDHRDWDALEFNKAIPRKWGTVFSINRVEKGGESYTFWFLAKDGTLRGVTTREFTGPNRASFFPEVYVIRRK